MFERLYGGLDGQKLISLIQKQKEAQPSEKKKKMTKKGSKTPAEESDAVKLDKNNSLKQFFTNKYMPI